MFNNMLMGAAGESIKATSFSVDNSLLINDGDNQYLRKINTGDSSSDPTNANTGTISVWFKRGDFPSGNNLRIWNHGDGTSPQAELLIMGSTNKLMVNGGATGFQLETTALFRDPHAWYHAVVRIDTNQSTSSDRIRLYINGTQITDLGTNTQPSQYQDVFTNLKDWWVGRWSGSTGHNWDGYISELVYCDGQSLAPTAFGETDNNGVWRPIDVDSSGLFTVSSTAEAIANSASATNSSGLTTYTYSGVALGTASSTRAVYVFATGQGPAASNFDVSSMTVGGVSATRVADVTNSDEAQYVSELWRADVPSGTTGDIVVTWNSAMSQCGVIAWAVTGDHNLFDIQTNLSDSTASFTLTDIPDDSVILAGRGGTSSRTHTWSSDVTENVDEVIGSGVVQSGASSAKSTGGDFTVTCTPSSSESRPRTVCIVLSPTQGAGDQGFYLPFTDSNYIGADYSTGSGIGVARTEASEWNGDTGDFGTLDVDIIATGGNQGAIRTNKTFTGNFAFDFTWKGGSNPAYVGVYEIDEDGTFSSGSSDGGMGSMTDSFYLFFTSGNAVNALKGSSTEASSIFTAASGELIKFQRSGSEFKVFEDGTLRHTFTGTSSSEVRILIGQSSSSLDWEYFRWVNGSTTLSGGSVGGTGGFFAVDSPTQTTDSPTTNAATFSPLITRHQTNFTQVLSDWTFTNGNRTLTHTSGSSGDIMAAASQLLQPGQKYHFEAVTESMHSSAYARFALALVPQSMWETDSSPLTGTNDQFTISLIKSGGTGSNSATFDNGSLTAPTNKPTTNSRLTFEVDMSTISSTTVRYYFDGSLDTTYSSLAFADEPYYVVSFTGTETDRNGVFNFNFGSSAFTDTPTSGHTGLTAKDAFAGSAPTIEDGSAHFQATTYSGNGGSNEINQSENSQFQPDLVWLKERDGGNHGTLIDAVRGANKGVYPSLNFAEYTESNLSFDADGFSLSTTGAAAQINGSSNTYIGWQWLAGNATSTPSGGSESSTVSVNQTNGFSVVSWTGTGANATIAHGLGAAPSWILIKNLADADSWVVYHDSMGATKGAALDTSDAPATASTFFNDTAPTSTVFSVGSGGRSNGSSDAMIAYCWCEKPGFSKFGSFEGNGNANGPFVDLGFKPAFLMVKGIDSGSRPWVMHDSARNPFNVTDLNIVADSNTAEASSNLWDFLSNGFKIRDALAGDNENNKTYIYMAFAENPFAGTTPATAR